MYVCLQLLIISSLLLINTAVDVHADSSQLSPTMQATIVIPTSQQIVAEIALMKKKIADSEARLGPVIQTEAKQELKDIVIDKKDAEERLREAKQLQAEAEAELAAAKKTEETAKIQLETAEPTRTIIPQASSTTDTPATTNNPPQDIPSDKPENTDIDLAQKEKIESITNVTSPSMVTTAATQTKAQPEKITAQPNALKKTAAENQNSTPAEPKAVT